MTPAEATTAAMVLKATYSAVPCPVESTTSGKEADTQVFRSYLNQKPKLKLKLYMWRFPVCKPNETSKALFGKERDSASEDSFGKLASGYHLTT